MTDVLSMVIMGQIALLTLNRPEKLDALDNNLLAAIVVALDGIELNPAVRAVVITELAGPSVPVPTLPQSGVMWRPVRLRLLHVSCGQATG